MQLGCPGGDAVFEVGIRRSKESFGRPAALCLPIDKKIAGADEA
jgi:hypothetical protein